MEDSPEYATALEELHHELQSGGAHSSKYYAVASYFTGVRDPTNSNDDTYTLPSTVEGLRASIEESRRTISRNPRGIPVNADHGDVVEFDVGRVAYTYLCPNTGHACAVFEFDLNNEIELQAAALVRAGIYTGVSAEWGTSKGPGGTYNQVITKITLTDKPRIVGAWMHGHTLLDKIVGSQDVTPKVSESPLSVDSPIHSTMASADAAAAMEVDTPATHAEIPAQPRTADGKYASPVPKTSQFHETAEAGLAARSPLETGMAPGRVLMNESQVQGTMAEFMATQEALNKRVEEAEAENKRLRLMHERSISLAKYSDMLRQIDERKKAKLAAWQGAMPEDHQHYLNGRYDQLSIPYIEKAVASVEAHEMAQAEIAEYKRQEAELFEQQRRAAEERARHGEVQHLQMVHMMEKVRAQQAEAQRRLSGFEGDYAQRLVAAAAAPAAAPMAVDAPAPAAVPAAPAPQMPAEMAQAFNAWLYQQMQTYASDKAAKAQTYNPRTPIARGIFNETDKDTIGTFGAVAEAGDGLQQFLEAHIPGFNYIEHTAASVEANLNAFRKIA